MAKATIRRLLARSLIALAGALTYANGSPVLPGLDVTRIREVPSGWVIAVVAVLVMMAVAITQFIAWAGSVTNAARRHDKTWFTILLVTGLLSFGFIAMLIGLIAVA